MAAAVVADFREFGPLQRKIDTLVGLMDGELREGIGALLESSTRLRFTTKLSPEGTPWPAWSRGYAAKRPPGKSLLLDSGGLADSVQYETTKDTITIFEPMEHANTHQHGDQRLITIRPHRRRITQAFGKSLKFPVITDVGTRQQKRNIPPRPSLGMSADDVAEIERLVDGLTAEALS